MNTDLTDPLPDSWWTAEQIHTLRVGDVVPLPLMVETNWAADGWEVNVCLVTDVVPGGYSSFDVWTHREPYRDNDATRVEAGRVTDAALTAFGHRLRTVLAG